ncbi:MAG TPA: glycoside hydrolase family 127 protein [Verrucomicrobiae bacterium]|jgi:hypothetical protein|nr:glycoside hydrolase family 127 protein [Verrucomicrobiae bacterium]
MNACSIPGFAQVIAWSIILLAAAPRPGCLAKEISAGAPIPAALFPLRAVRLLDSPFSAAAAANRAYLLALDPDRLLAPFLKEAGLKPRAPFYGSWESGGLGGHTAGHYLSALGNMIAAGEDTADCALRHRLEYMLAELDRCQKAGGNGYIGGVPDGPAFWKDVAGGHIDANGFGINGKWVPWYNLHKTFAGLRDAWLVAGEANARDILVRYGDWCVGLISHLSDDQMQTMLQAEQGGMCETLADIYAITGDDKFLHAARRFQHKAFIDPLLRHEDHLTGLHANTQIPKVIGLERIAALTGDAQADSAARFFWEDVTSRRSVAFGGNSVSEHFNDPANFRGMLESREGPETCNTYNMLRLTEQLFASEPRAAYADYYERALYNHILASIHPVTPGYVYFTPIRPGHYRVYSQPEQCFWCCVGTGMENPGKYGEFIYAQDRVGVYVNLFIPSELSATNFGLTLRQETQFPDVPRTSLTLNLTHATNFSLRLRHPGWVAAGAFAVRLNGQTIDVTSAPSSYVDLNRVWNDGDRLEIELPMQTTTERLLDGSDWVAILRGPIVLANPDGVDNLIGLRADDSRMGHVAHGPLRPLDRVPVLLARAEDVPAHVQLDSEAGPLRFRLKDVVAPATNGGLQLMPFFRLHDSRYQMYWQLATPQELEVRQAGLAGAEQAKAALEANTLDWLALGEQQPEVEHGLVGEALETGWQEDRHWRRGSWFQCELNPRGEQAAALIVTYCGGVSDRDFEIYANGLLMASHRADKSKSTLFTRTTFSLPSNLVRNADGHLTVKFSGHHGPTACICEIRLMRSAAR